MPPIILALLAPQVVIPAAICVGFTTWIGWIYWNSQHGDSYKRHKGKSL